MAFSAINSSNIEVGDPVTNDLWTKVKDNFDDHETRVASLETNANRIYVFNKIIRRPSEHNVGDIKWSFLTLAEFQARFDTTWILADGQTITGDELANLRSWTTIPDLRGEFLRGLDNGRGVDSGRTMGSTQSGQNVAHTHVISTQDHDPIAVKDDLIGTDNSTTYTINGGSTIDVTLRDLNNPTFQANSDGGTEARPRSIAANCFVKTDESSYSGLEVFRSPIAMNLVSAVVTNISAGTSGTLQADITKGSNLTSMTTMFSTKPSVTSASGDGASSSNAVFSTQAVAANDFLQLDVDTFQPGQETFHVFIIGEV